MTCVVCSTDSSKLHRSTNSKKDASKITEITPREQNIDEKTLSNTVLAKIFSYPKSNEILSDLFFKGQVLRNRTRKVEWCNKTYNHRRAREGTCKEWTNNALDEELFLIAKITEFEIRQNHRLDKKWYHLRLRAILYSYIKQKTIDVSGKRTKGESLIYKSLAPPKISITLPKRL